jgi:hypothetical protein
MRAGAHAWEVWLKPALIVLPFLWSVPAGIKSLAKVIDQLPRELLQAATVLREIKAPGDRIIARKPHIGYLADIEVRPFPFAKSFGELADAARRERVRWLLFSWPEAETRPAFWHLLDTTGHVPGLTVRFATPARPVVLFEIDPGFGPAPDWYANDTLKAWHNARAHLRVNGADARSWFTLAFIERTRGNDALALAHVQRALRFDPRNFEALLLLGDLRLGANDGSQAMAAYLRAQALAPDRAEPLVGMGWASVVSGRPDEAAATWRPIVGVVRDPATLRRMIGVFRATGDTASEAQARASLARLMERR